LSTRLKKKLERIQQFILELTEDSARGLPIIVEGKKDVEALRSLGVEGPVLTVKTGGKSFVQVLQEIEESGIAEVILLLDFDRRGKQGIALLKGELERSKIKVNLNYWKAFSAVVGREIQCVEGLSSYMKTLQQKTI
jgi:5S rRNA maturation endonuclease (ribonuclease M5)